jgi:CRP-like cAMP-binding protein
VPAGEVLVAEGGTSDRFYVIVSGEVEVTQAGRVLRTEGPGDFFGEIGLLRNVLRTATVTATADCELLVVEQADFLGAVSLMGGAISVLDDAIVRRLYA